MSDTHMDFQAHFLTAQGSKGPAGAGRCQCATGLFGLVTFHGEDSALRNGDAVPVVGRK